jgi:hypothetical protein
MCTLSKKKENQGKNVLISNKLFFVLFITHLPSLRLFIFNYMNYILLLQANVRTGVPTKTNHLPP